MKKRILAMLLVLCLVMSVMPMTVLATEAECPKEHTVDNCENKLVDTVPAKDCKTPGYDLYVCVACGEPFVVVGENVAKHDYVVVATGSAAAACGKKYCKVCGEPKAHQYNCEGKCTVCNEKSTESADKFHKWDYENAVIVKEPASCTEDGLMKLVCTLCGKDGEAIIAAEHKWVVGKPSDEPAKCDKDGWYAHDKCSVCGKCKLADGTIVDASATVVPAGHVFGYEIKEYADLKGAARVDYIYLAPNNNGYTILALAKANVNTPVQLRQEVNGDMKHLAYLNNDVESTIQVAAGIGRLEIKTRKEGATVTSLRFIVINNDYAVKLNDASCSAPATYKVSCTRCNLANTFKVVSGAAPKHQWHVESSIAPNCLRNGYEIRTCTVCQEHEYKILDQLDCVNTYAKALAYAAAKDEDGNLLHPDFITTTDPSCTVKGSYDWNCPECGDPFDHEIAATGYIPATYVIPATSCHGGITITYCANGADCTCKCTCTDDQKNECFYCKNFKGAITSWTDKKGNVINIMLPNDAGQLVNAKIYVFGYSTEAEKEKDNKNIHDYILDTDKTTVFCGNSQGVEVYYCSYCGKYDYKQIIDIPHSGYIEMDSAEYKAYKAEASKPGSTLPAEPVNLLNAPKATCQSPLVKWTYICADCGEVVTVDEDKYEYKNVLTLKELKDLHGLTADDVTWLSQDPAGKSDCTTADFGLIEDTDCCHVALFILDVGEHELEYSVDKCNKDNVPCVVTCKYCDYTTSSVLPHSYPNPESTPTCTNPGSNAWGECTVCGYYQKQIIPGVKHNVNQLLESFDGDCDSFAGSLAYCAECGAMVLSDYVPVVHKFVEAEKVEASCVEDGYVKYVCSECGIEKLIESSAAGYHTNSWFGRPSNPWKVDPTACPECNKALNPTLTLDITEPFIADSFYICDDCGDLREWTGSDATCQKAGYKLYMYDCGHGNQFVYYPKEAECVYVPVNHGSYWSKICKWCGDEKIQPEDPGIFDYNGKVSLNMDVELHSIPNTIVTEGTEITVYVSLAGLEKAIWGYNFDVYYDGNYVEFLGFEMLTENFQYNAIVNPRVTKTPIEDKDGNVIGYNYSNHHISVIGSIKLAGENYILNGEEDLVALKFKVNNVPGIFEDKDLQGTIGFEFGPKIYISYNAEAYDGMRPVSYASADIYTLYDRNENATKIELDTTRLMDADGNGTVHFNDAILIWNMVSGVVENDYSSIVDVNGNNVVDAVDATLIFRYLTGLISYEDILNYHA